MHNARRKTKIISSSILTVALIGIPSIAHANDAPTPEVTSEVQLQAEITPEVVEAPAAPEIIVPEPEVVVPEPAPAPVVVPEPAPAPEPEPALEPAPEVVPDKPSVPVEETQTIDPIVVPQTAPAVEAQQRVITPEEELVPEPAPVVVDTEKPVVTLAATPVIFNSNNVDLTVQASDNVELAKIVGNIRNAAGVLVKPAQIAASGTSSALVVDLAGLGNGTYNLRYNAVDTAGNMSTTQSFDFTIDNTAPTVTIKPESLGSDGTYKSASFKLFDAGKVDKVVLNGVVKDLSNSTYSDLNGVKPGVFGAIEGLNTLEVFDVAGNSTVTTFTLDTTGPTLTVKPEGTTGADGVYQKVSYKLFDNAKVVKAILNGVEKQLTPNKYSDLNGIVPGTFGAVEGVNTLVLVDSLGNRSTHTFTLDTTKPVINTPAVEWVNGSHTWTITQDEANPAKAYVEIQQMVNGKWKKFAGVWIYNSNDLSATFDTTGLTSGVQSQIKISSWDTAGNQSGASFATKIDNTVPTITVKPESIGSDGVYSDASFKLFDSLSGVDKVLVNGVVKDLTDNKWSDLNSLKPGRNGAVEGVNTIVVQDVAGNTASLTITLDATAPTVTSETHEWQTKDGGRDSITVTFSEPVTGLPQGWNGSGTTWTKVFYNTKPHTLTFVDQAGNAGTYTVTPNAEPTVEIPTPVDPEIPSEPTDPEPNEPTVPETPVKPEVPIELPLGNSPEPSNEGDDVTPTGTQPIVTVTQVTTPALTPVSSSTHVTTASPTVASAQPTLPVTGGEIGALGGLSGLLVALGALIKRFS